MQGEKGKVIFCATCKQRWEPWTWTFQPVLSEAPEARRYRESCSLPNQRRNEGGAKGEQLPGHRVYLGAANHCGGAEKSRQCHKHFLQYSTFASERPQCRTWGRQTCFLPGRHLTTLRPCPQLFFFRDKSQNKHGKIMVGSCSAFKICFCQFKTFQVLMGLGWLLHFMRLLLLR